MKYRDTASFGKRQEYAAIAELLTRGFDVYMTLVDDQGIDCVIRRSARRYLDIQIKARSKNAKQWHLFAAMKFVPRSNLYFVFYTEKNHSFWTIPSRAVKRLGYVNKTGKHQGKISLALPKRLDGTKYERFERYHNENRFKALR